MGLLVASYQNKNGSKPTATLKTEIKNHSAWVHSHDCTLIDKDEMEEKEFKYACYKEGHSEFIKQGWKGGFLEQIFQLGNKKVNIIVITGFGTIALETEGKIGHYRAKTRIGKSDSNSLVIIQEGGNDKVILLPTTYDLNNENRQPEIYRDIKIIPSQFELVK